MTSWDLPLPAGQPPPQVADHRPLVEPAGLQVSSYEDSEDWHTRCVLFADFLLEHAGDLAREAGAPVEGVRAGISEMRATIDCMPRRFILIAQRPGSPD